MSHATHSYEEALKLIARGYDEGESFSGTRCAEIAKAALSMPPSRPGDEEKRRIAACVHACSGFVTEWLEQNEFWPLVLLTSDEYAELVIAKRKLESLSHVPAVGGDKLTAREEGYLDRLHDRCNILRARIGAGTSNANFISEWRRELTAFEWALSRLGATPNGVIHGPE